MPLYRCIAADPAWPERGGGKCRRGAQRHYETIPVRQIPRVMRESGVWTPDTQGCHLWLWVTGNYLKGGLWVMEELGFRYANFLTWNKLGKFGLGQYLRYRTEIALLGVMGVLPGQARDVDGTVDAPRGRHSEKPAEAYRRFERASPGPRLEMFARGPRDGWDVWGAEASGGAR